MIHFNSILIVLSDKQCVHTVDTLYLLSVKNTRMQSIAAICKKMSKNSAH